MLTVYSVEDVGVSGSGHYVTVRALTPTLIPDNLLPAALAAGCKLADVPANHGALDDDQAAWRARLSAAVQHLLDTDDDPEHFKLDGTPVLRVVAGVMGVPARQVKAGDVYDVYAELVLNRRLAEPTA